MTVRNDIGAIKGVLGLDDEAKVVTGALNVCIKYVTTVPKDAGGHPEYISRQRWE